MSDLGACICSSTAHVETTLHIIFSLKITPNMFSWQGDSMKLFVLKCSNDIFVLIPDDTSYRRWNCYQCSTLISSQLHRAFKIAYMMFLNGFTCLLRELLKYGSPYVSIRDSRKWFNYVFLFYSIVTGNEGQSTIRVFTSNTQRHKEGSVCLSTDVNFTRSNIDLDYRKTVFNLKN